MPKCSASTRAGTPCKGVAIEGSEWCFSHHPDHVEERRRHGSKGGKRGGRGRPMSELQNVKQRLLGLADEVLVGDVERSDAAVVSQIFGTYIRAASVEMKMKEILELEGRLEALEESMGSHSVTKVTPLGSKWRT
jgi:hypothetical protein